MGKDKILPPGEFTESPGLLSEFGMKNLQGMRTTATDPAVSQAQQKLMGADLARARAGKKTRTGMSAAQLEDYAGTPRKGLPKRA